MILQMGLRICLCYVKVYFDMKCEYMFMNMSIDIEHGHTCIFEMSFQNKMCLIKKAFEM